jgi:hypothetical protein
MTLQEKALYHQIHPIKLTADVASQLTAIYYFWFHHLALAIAVMVIVPLVVSLFLVSYVKLDHLKNSQLGIYLQRYINRSAENVRVVGALIMMIGAWQRIPILILGGIGIILLGWLRGVLWYWIA